MAHFTGVTHAQREMMVDITWRRGTVAVVTGGARGLGFACAHRLAEGGVSVVLLDREQEISAAAVRKLPATDLGHIGVAADVTSRKQVSAALARGRTEIGVPTILVNCAGTLEGTRFLDITDEAWRRVVGVSLDGTFICSQLCIPGMVEMKFGRIVNFSSTAGKTVSTLGGAHYTAAKTAVLGLTRAVAKEMARYGITVNAVCPGLIDTEMVREACTPEQIAQYAEGFPVRRLGTPSEVADLVAFLCSESAAYVTGASFDINGGDLMI